MIHLEIESFDALVKGFLEMINKEEHEPRTGSVFLMYHFNARTGHHTLSSLIEEKVWIEERKMGAGR